ncbi:uroporphyrinogen decarboxylase family protein, partial [Ornithobacterium rhinotracheale]
VNENLQYVFDALDITKKELNDEIPLIGFAGSPWTIFCYAVHGQGSKNFETAKPFAFTEPTLAQKLLQKIKDSTILYLEQKAKQHLDDLQNFHRWGGKLSPKDYKENYYQYIEQIVNPIYKNDPVVVFAKGRW